MMKVSGCENKREVNWSLLLNLCSNKTSWQRTKDILMFEIAILLNGGQMTCNQNCVLFLSIVVIQE